MAWYRLVAKPLAKLNMGQELLLPIDSIPDMDK